MINILFVHFGDNWIRGSERCLIDLITHLDKTQFKPVVWCNSEILAKALGKINVETVVDEFKVCFGYKPFKGTFSDFFRQVQKGRGLIKKFDIDLIHANSGAPCQWMVPVARLSQKPIIGHLHAYYAVPKDRFTLGLHQPDRVIGVSHAVVEPLLEDGIRPECVKVISNGIDIERLMEQPPMSLRTALCIGKHDKVLVTVGSLIERKGVDFLINAVNDLHRQNYKVHLVVVGSGPEQASLTNLAYDLGLGRYIHFLGELSFAFSVVKSLGDIYVSGAKDEVFGLVLAEAGLAGLPSVALKVGGIPEVVEDNKTGFLIEKGDRDSFCKKIIKLLDSEQLRSEIGTHAKSRIEREFNVQRYVDKFEGLYLELVNSRRSPLSLITGWRCITPAITWLFSVVWRKVSGVCASQNANQIKNA